jgi:hypothetical protein
MQGGDTWGKWYPMVKSNLLKTVKRERDNYHWNSVGRGGVGPVFTTSVFTMILAMPYHYIPLYQR